MLDITKQVKARETNGRWELGFYADNQSICCDVYDWDARQAVCYGELDWMGHEDSETQPIGESRVLLTNSMDYPAEHGVITVEADAHKVMLTNGDATYSVFFESDNEARLFRHELDGLAYPMPRRLEYAAPNEIRMHKHLKQESGK